ncbi:endonuclease/exonuclease/phosphatase family protein [Thaumasiovibrio sp. DFM-14]|uniref:endonuclease/exonuclease/phosphatase family protein n=1 Tax=Thaumasiovibrio sp. DFM-14 TaxID=3384792 RepID=UPI0039A17876
MLSKRQKLLTASAIVVMVAGGGACQFVDRAIMIPEYAEVLTLDSQQLRCFQNENSEIKPLDNNGLINLTVWNIYKGGKPGWQEGLNQFSHHADLVLLQEASLHDEFRQYLEQTPWQVAMANAFTFFSHSAGVLNLSRTAALQSCAYLSVEPWLKLPKSALYAEFLLSDGQTLAVVNLHGINFTLGTEQYQQQLGALTAALRYHVGPMIVAGDFNTWRKGRQRVVEDFAKELGLSHTLFNDDYRTRVLGLPLDHLFYRGLQLVEANAPQTDASDHNPLLAQFQVMR